MNDSADDNAFMIKPSESDSYVKRPRGRAAGHTAQRARQDNHYVLDLIQALQGHPAGRRRWSIMQAIRTNRRNAGLGIPHQIEDDVERAFLEHCVDAENFKKRNRAPESALFHWPQGRAAGIWSVYPDRIDSWLRDNIPGS